MGEIDDILIEIKNVINEMNLTETKKQRVIYFLSKLYIELLYLKERGDDF